jgi:DNA-binding beta-propeller fold protein YncE
MVYVADSGNNRILMFTSSGAYLTQWGTRGTGNGQFNRPYGVAVDGSGNVYVADTNNNRIQVFGSLPVPTKSTSWGRLKWLYR